MPVVVTQGHLFGFVWLFGLSFFLNPGSWLFQVLDLSLNIPLSPAKMPVYLLAFH